ncbi:MAG: hypothetical protein VW454_07235 [Pelagibacteraceae bacterium]|jgi:hypothetical protein
MTTEARPQKDWMEAYYNQRRDRLADAVGDYLTCDDTSARQCYEEMLAEVDGWIKHHRQHLNKAQALKDLLMGERNANMDFPHWPGEVTTKQFLQEDTIPDRY